MSVLRIPYSWDFHTPQIVYINTPLAASSFDYIIVHSSTFVAPGKMPSSDSDNKYYSTPDNLESRGPSSGFEQHG